MNELESKVSLAFTLIFFILTTLLHLALAWPFKWCWNYAMPYVFNLPEIEWGHAFCLIWVLSYLKTTIVDKKI